MKNAKLLVIALIVVIIFSVSAVSAAENTFNATSSDLTQVPHEQVVSVPESTSVQEVETINLETSDDEKMEITNEIKLDSDDLKSTDSNEESLSESKKGEEVSEVSYDKNILRATDSKNVLGASITPSGLTFQDIRDSISDAKDGDVIDLGGKVYTGTYSRFSVNKNITIINGILNPSSTVSAGMGFNNCKLVNITFQNFYYNTTAGKWPINFDNAVLENVNFINISIPVAFGTVQNTKLEGCKFINLTSRLAHDDDNFEWGAMLIMYTSEVNNSLFYNCTTNRHSGAICVGGRPGNIVNITNTDFISCHAGIGGAIYVHGTHTTPDHYSNIINCNFINCSASEWGGALGSSQDYLNVEDCNFINNTAKQGAAFMVGGITHGLDGDNSQGHYNTMKNCYFFNNTGSEEGGAVHITGHHNSAIDCIFDDNFAVNGKGAAIYVEGDYASIEGSNFTNHKSEMGTVYIEGNYFNCSDSLFEGNTASHGGAGIYVEGNHTYIYNSRFMNNNASRHGGAVHSIGDNARIYNSEFTYNNAIPSSNNSDYGLGGAIYIDGDDNEISFSEFRYNTARNGSAIYNRGEGLILNDDTFEHNQAWSYFLFTYANPTEAYWDENLETLINVTLVAGDNLINAIYNDRSVEDIYFHNVTYYMKPNDLYPTGKKTTGPDEVHPVDGVENSQGGKYLYQDAREDDQVIKVNITHENNKVFEYEGKTDMYGNVLLSVKKEDLIDGQYRPGVYDVTASHPDDTIYTAIENTTSFRVLPHVDVSVTKNSDKDVYFVGENAVFTIKVYCIGTNATNVKVRDILPQSFEFVSAQPTQGKYNNVTNEWDVGFLPHEASQTLILTVKTTQLGTFDNVVNVTCTEKDWNLSNNVDNKTINVDLYYTKESNVTEALVSEYIEYYIRVYNLGSTDYKEVVRVTDVLPEGIRYADYYKLEGADLVGFSDYIDKQVWEITNIAAQTHAMITVKALAVKEGIWNNTVQVRDYPPVNATVNISTLADLEVIKVVSDKTPKYGDVITWTITVINHGPNDAVGAYVTDLLPSGVSYVSDDSNGAYDSKTGIWDIGDLGKHADAVINIKTLVDVVETTITNVAVVNSTTPDNNESNNKDDDTITVAPTCDLEIIKIVSDKTPKYGDEIIWTITVVNHGPSDASGVYVDDLLPAGIIYVDDDSNGAYVNGRWIIGDLPKHGDAIINIRTIVNVANDTVTNVAVVNSSTPDYDESNNKDNDTITVDSIVDLKISKMVSDSNPKYLDEIVWAIGVINNGPSDASGVYVDDLLPAGISYVSDDSNGAYNPKTGIWYIGDLGKHADAIIQIKTIVMISNVTITNVAVVNSSTPDYDESNNKDNDTIDVDPICDVAIEKSVDNHSPKKGDIITWTITVTNNGPDKAVDVIVNDVIPANLRFVDYYGDRRDGVMIVGTLDSYYYTWFIGDLDYNESVTLNIRNKVDVTADVITNVAKVTTVTPESDLTNNEDNATIDIGHEADLEVIKEASNHNPKKGEIITWTVTVVNHGPDRAIDVFVSDVLPAGLIYVSDDSNGKYNNNVWDIGTLENNTNVTLTITTKVDVSNATITNVAVVDSDTHDPDDSNNEDNDTINVGPIVDLVIEKSVDNHNPKKGDIVTWTVTVTNNGPDTAVNVVVSDVLPAGLIYISSDGNYANNVWNIGDLTNGGGVTLKIRTLVDVTAAVITNVANVTTDTPESDLTNNNDSATIDVGHEADLEVIKVVSDSTPKYGDVITWTVTVVNHGPDKAVDVVVSDVLPAGLIYISDDSNGKYNNNIWDIGTLENKASVTLVITTKVDVSNANVTNVANVTSDTHDPDDSNNEDNDTIEVSPMADVEVIKVVSISKPHNGDEIIWTISVFNHGPNDAVNVVVSDVLPADLIYVSDDGEGAYDSKTGAWNVGDLHSGRGLVLNIVTKVDASDVNITNIANATSDTYDPDDSNNEDNDTIEVNPIVDLVIEKSVDNHNPKKGDIVTWTVTVTNNGPDTALNVIVSDVIPNGLIYISSDGNYANNVWNIGDLTNGGGATLKIRTLVDVTAAVITNVANVTSDTPESDLTNNNDSATIDIGHEADLEVIKVVSNPTPNYGDEIVWTVTVVNHGPDNAVDVFVSDVLPAGLIYVSDDSNGKYNNNVWDIGTLENKASVTLKISTKVDISNTNLTNVANVTADTHDPDDSNNEDNDTIEVPPMADVEVIKFVSNPKPHNGDVIVWTVSVFNHGPQDAVNVVVSDVLPVGLVYVSDDGEGSYESKSGSWHVGDLHSGRGLVLNIITKVNASNTNITNVAVATLDTYDPNETNNEDNDTIEVDPIVDLVIEKSVDNHNPKKGDIVTWTVTVTNNGPDTAVNVIVSDVLPAGLIYISSDGNYANNVWNIGDLTDGGSATLKIRTMVDVTAAVITNVANVTTDTHESDLTNNNDSATIDIGHEADLEVIKEASNHNPKKGEIITWTVTVVNHGPDKAVDVTVIDILPAGLIYVSDDSNGKYNNNVWDIGTLENKGVATLTITTQVDISNATITNVVVVESDTHDPEDSNNKDNDTVDVPSMADVEVTKVASHKTPNYGDEVTWTVSVFNHGPDVAVNVIVSDVLPAGLIYVSDDGEGSYESKSGSWYVGDLHSGRGLVLNIITKVNASNTNITNVAVATSSTYDPNEINNKDNDTVVVPPMADLEVLKFVSNSTVHKGDAIVWTIVVTNNGPNLAENVYVKDILPNGLIFVSADGEYDSVTGIWTIGSLGSGENKSLAIQTVADITDAAITNIASVNSTTHDPDMNNNKANNTTSIPPEADLGIVKEVNAKECVKDQIVEWTITMSNYGPDGAENVIVMDNLPDTLIFISSDGEYDPDVGIWTIDYLASGETRVLHIVTKVNTTNQVIVNNATATSGTYDPNMENNKASNSTTVGPLSDLEIVKVISNANPHRGDVITWTITVTNNGPDTAKNVTVSDNLPDGLIFKDADGSYDENNGIWAVGDLYNGESKSLVITTIVDITNANITNVAVVTSDTPDSNETNNRDNDTAKINPESDIKVIKTVSNPEPRKGDVITWTIVVTNLGPDAAKDVSVEENLPDGLRLISAKGTKGSFEDGIWTIGTLNNGEIVTLVLTTEVTSSDTIENVVVATSSTYDPNETNNKDKEVITPKYEPSADLEIIKIANVEKVKVGDKIIWTITVINHGPDAAKNVRVVDVASGDIEYISSKSSKGIFDTSEGIWTIGDMESGETAVLTLEFKALSDGIVVNTAEVVSDTPDPNEDNNRDNSVVTVEPNNPTPETSTSTPASKAPARMPATGNPIAIVFLALIIIAGVTLRRKC